MKLRNVTISAGVLVTAAAAAWLWAQCMHSDGVATGKQLQKDENQDRRNAAIAAAIDSSDRAWQRVVDSLTQGADTLRAQLAVQEPRSTAAASAIEASPDSMIPKRQALAALAEKDVTIGILKRVIAQDSVGIRRRDARILGLRDTVGLYRDSIVPGLTRSRNYWRKRALAACGADVGVGVTSKKGDLYVGCRVPLPRLGILGL